MKKKNNESCPECGRFANRGVTVDALIIKEEKILLIKRNAEPFKGFWALPGGYVDWNERVEDAIKREVSEEVGLDVKSLNFVGVFSDPKRHPKQCINVAYVAEAEGDIKPGDDAIECKWESIDSLPELAFDHKKIIDYYLKNFSGKESSEKYLDSWKRCQADFENYKKDQVKHQEEFRKYAKMDVIEQILPILDNFEASLEHVPKDEKENKWVEGIVYIKKQIEDILKNNNLEEIEVKIGDKFNPEIHEAIGGEGAKQIIKKIVQKGYKLNGRIMRAAKVEVS
jgi:8-oxo-dGTP diphosphatase